MNINHKNIIITGASSGIGKALAIELAVKASTLVLVARRKELLNELSIRLKKLNPNLTVILCPNDITSVSQQQEIASVIKSRNVDIDLLINNAGMGDERYFHLADMDKLQRIIDLNISATTTFTHLILKEMMLQPRGKSLLFVGSGAGIAWMPGSAIYSASKHFITAFAMNLKSELEPFGMQVSLVTPGPVDSEFDEIAGIENGMQGGPSQKTRISAEECAKERVEQMQKSKTLILPGSRLRMLMKLYINFPWFIRQRLLLKEGKRLYHQTHKEK